MPRIKIQIFRQCCQILFCSTSVVEFAIFWCVLLRYIHEEYLRAKEPDMHFYRLTKGGS